MTAFQRGRGYQRVFVRPGVRERWEVLMEGRAQRSRFMDRDLALSYAQIWAAVNRPSTVLAYGAEGTLENDWIFDRGGRDRR